MTGNQNTFEKLEKEGAIKTGAKAPAPAPTPQAISESNEFDINELSETAVGDKQKYVRENLDGTEQIVKQFQIFKADDKSERKKAMNNPSVEFCQCTAILTYESANPDGINNREYLSGTKQFVQRDGSLSEPTFWYPNATKTSQIAMLWEAVAGHLAVKPEEMAPRTFYTFLNSKPKAKIVAMEFQFPGSPKVDKNIVKNFI